MRIMLTLQVAPGPREHDKRMVNMSVSPIPVEAHQEIIVVENEDQVLEDQSVMEDVRMEVVVKPTPVKVVRTVKGY